MGSQMVEIIPRRLYWATAETVPLDNDKFHYFSVDDEFVYEGFCKDFGPLNLGMIVDYCMKLYKKLADASLSKKCVVHVCSPDYKKRANAVVLMGAFQVFVLQRPSHIAHAPFEGIQPPLKPFRDASNGPCSFHLTLKDCLDAFHFVTETKLFDWSRFKIAIYEHYSHPENGDMNWIIPGKFLAFAGPSPKHNNDEGYNPYTPEDYAANFAQAPIGLVVRLNRPCYDKRRFTKHGIKHVDLYFKDGSCPSREIISEFFRATDNEPSGVAVHCKAGLGRTGTLIGLAAMKNLFFPARAYIAWSRMCRPGSVLGHQQQFLVDMQAEMFQAGAAARGLCPAFPLAATEGDGTDADLAQQASGLQIQDDRSDEQQQGDAGQGERLTSAPTTASSALSSSTCSSEASADDRSDEQQEGDAGQGERLTSAKWNRRWAPKTASSGSPSTCSLEVGQPCWCARDASAPIRPR